MLIIAFAAALALAPDSAAADDPPTDPASDLATLQQLYDSSCGSRGYGSYDDVCNQIGEQMREAQRTLSRAPARPVSSTRQPPSTHTTLPPSKPMGEAPTPTDAAPGAPSSPSGAKAPASDPPSSGAATPPAASQS